MSRILNSSRHNRAMKQSMLFANPAVNTQDDEPTSAYSEYAIQDDVYAQFNSAISAMHQTPQLQDPSAPTQTTSRRRKHQRSQPNEVLQTNNNGTMQLPEGFSTVRLNDSDIADIAAINDNASFRSLSTSMYEDSNNTESHYKQTVINNMTRDVLQTAQYLCQASGSDNRTYENQVGTATIDTSYGAHQLNMLAARRIIGQEGK